jgi:peptidoglycan/xylan/chitin deacetylase (PgdA/CDA1 family)
LKLSVETPFNYSKERNYIISVLLDEFLGLDFQIIQSSHEDIIIYANNDSQLIIKEDLFSRSELSWRKKESLPLQPLKIWEIPFKSFIANVVDYKMPVIFGNNPVEEDFFEISENKIKLGIDIFGSSFFMLSRYEELIKSDRDRFNRFPAKSSLAYQEDFLDRPIIDEYVEILWSCLKYLYPTLKRKQNKFNILLSHDLDHPFKHAFCSFPKMIKACGGDIFLRQKPLNIFNRSVEWIKVKSGNINSDPYNNFDNIMDISEKHNLKSSFYFASNNNSIDPAKNKFYDIRHPLIRMLLRKINNRGHEVGLHGSYNSFNDAQQIEKEFICLKKVSEEEGIVQDFWGARQHFLRYEIPTTFQILNDAKLNIDATLSYPDLPGFRCGTCHEYSAYNIITNKTLSIKIRPLIVMDSTVFGDPEYMGLTIDDDEAYETIIKFKQNCRLVNGNFTMLWHNTSLIEDREIDLYNQIIKT